MSEWISVKDRLPEIKKVKYDDFSESIYVIIFMRNGYQAIAQYCEWLENKNPAMWDEFSGTSHKPDRVTHWMPLPEPPK